MSATAPTPDAPPEASVAPNHAAVGADLLPACDTCCFCTPAQWGGGGSVTSAHDAAGAGVGHISACRGSRRDIPPRHALM